MKSIIFNSYVSCYQRVTALVRAEDSPWPCLWVLRLVVGPLEGTARPDPRVHRELEAEILNIDDYYFRCLYVDDYIYIHR